MLREEEGGKLVAMLEKRAVDVRREGYFIVQVSTYCVCCVVRAGSFISDSDGWQPPSRLYPGNPGAAPGASVGRVGG